MNGDKIKTVLIYLLVLVILGLTTYLIYFVLEQNKIAEEANKNAHEDIYATVPEVPAKCVFSLQSYQYYAAINGNSEFQICPGLNKFILTGYILAGKDVDLQVLYFNNDKGASAKTGVYLNNKRIIDRASVHDKNAFGIFDNKLFILSDNAEEANVYAYDANGNQVYNLATQLQILRIKDQAFIEIAKTKPINTTLDNKHLWAFGFNEGVFTFSSNSRLGCNSFPYSGTSYKVTYSGNNFNAPEVISLNSCG